jgi:hypothetical protein
MAVFVTNPSRSNGAVNALIAKSLGVKIGTVSGRAAVAAFKRNKTAYAAWLSKAAKAITTERAAKKKRTAAAKTPAGKAKRAAFLERVMAPAAAPATKRRTGKKAAGKAAPAAGGMNAMQIFHSGGAPSLKAAWAIVKGTAAPAAKRGTSAKKGKKRAAKKNPYGRRNGMVARANGAVQDAYGFVKERVFSMEGLTLAAVAAGVGAAHFYVAPMLDEQFAKIPYVGEYLSRAPYTVTGLLAGAIITAGGYALGQGRLGATAGALAASSGIVLDVVAYLTESRGGSLAGIEYSGIEYSGIGMSRGNPYGGLEVMSNPGYGADEYGALMEYSDATEADAYQSGEDFDAAEGQALLDGPGAFFRRFGRPARSASRTRSAYSRHAGKAGHRWAYLIKLVGFRRAAEIAALPAAQRVQVISEIRNRCVASLNAAMQNQQIAAQQDPYTIGMSGDIGAQGAQGASAYGSIVYAG